MKIIFYFYLFLTFSCSLSANPIEKEILYDSSFIPIKSIKIISQTLSIGVGEKGIIRRLTDSCKQSTYFMIPEQVNLNKVITLTENNWICIGDEGIIYRTTDSGNSWLKAETQTSSNLISISFLNKNIGICVGNGGLMLRTIDGGRIWKKLDNVTNENLLDITNVNNEFIAIGNNASIIKSTDEGITWTNLSIQTNENLAHICTPTDGLIYILGEFPNIFISENKGKSFIKSIIEPNFDEIGFKPEIVAFGFFGLDSGFIKVYDDNSCNYRELEYFTTNSGMSWIRKNRSAEINIIKPFIISCFDFSSSDYGVFCDLANVIMSAKFQLPEIKYKILKQSFSIQLNHIKKLNNNLFLPYENGSPICFYRSTDLGLSWINSQGLNIAPKDGGWYSYVDMEVPDINAIYIAINSNKQHVNGTTYYTTQNSEIMKTSDLGKTWSNYNFKNNLGLSDIEFYSKDYGIAYCWSMAIQKYYITCDGGTTWKNGLLPNIPYLNFWNLKVFSPGHIYMTIRKKDSLVVIASTNDEGITWEFSEPIPNNSNRILYFDENNFLVYSNSYSSKDSDITMYKTYDKGKNWEPDFKYNIFDNKDVIREIHSYNDKMMFGIDYNKTYYLTADSWKTHQTYLTENEINMSDALYTSPSELFISSSNGKLLKLILDNVSVSEKNSSVDQIKIFPNPTSEKLTLSQIPDGAVRYEIYDIFGERVLTVEAIHELPLQIDVSGLYPGVYFLKFNNQPPQKFVKI